MREAIGYKKDVMVIELEDKPLAPPLHLKNAQSLPEKPSSAGSKLFYQESRRELKTYDDSFGMPMKELNLRFLLRPTITGFLIIDFARRLIMAIVIVHVDIYPWAQLMLMMYLN